MRVIRYLRNPQNLLFLALLCVVAYFTIGPLLMLAYGSLHSSPPGVPGKFTFAHYILIYSDPRTFRLLWVTLYYSFFASLISFGMGAFLAWVVERTDAPLRTLISQLSLAPMFLPSVLVTLSWVFLLGPDTGLINNWLGALLGPDYRLNVYSLWGMIWVKGTVDIPLVYLWLSPSLKSMDPNLEEAGYASGASGLQVLKDISLPMLAPALLATWLITFILSIEDLAVPIFIGLPARVLVFASEIYLASSSPPTNVNVASTYAALLLVISLIGILLYRKATSASEKYAVVSGKAYRPRSLELGRSKWLVTGLALAILVLTVGLPVLLMLWNSFMPFAQTPTLKGLNLLTSGNYMDVFRSSLLVRSLKNSVLLGLTTGVVVMMVSSVIAWMVIRTKVRFREAVDFLAFLPIAIPGVVVGISLIWVYLTLPIPIYATKWILLVAYFTRFIPYGVRLSYVGQSQIHPELEEASAASGAGWLQTFRRITLVLLAPTMFAGIAYVLVRAFRELPASILLAHSGSEVFSVAVYSLWEVGALPRLAALGIFAIVVLVVSVLIVRKITGRYYISA